MSTCQTSSAVKPVDLVQNERSADVAPTLEAQLNGLQDLWAQTLGDSRICIAILDGPVDLSHPSIREAALTAIDLDEVTDSAAVSFSDHGTHVTSVIFGSHDGPVKGIAPNCRGLIIPIFRYAANGSLEPCSQERLAKAIRAAVRFGANVINISAGQFSSRGEASPELRAAVEACGEDVLIVSAAGNDGCDCLHVPGALPAVLAVGAMNAAGHPLPFSNWGLAYREQGVLAPGEKIFGAAGDGGVKAQSGTSFSTPIVSGVAGLLLSLQRKLGILPSSKSIRNAILATTHGCDPQTETQCERVLAGRLSISGSVSAVTRGISTMQHATNEPTSADASVQPTVEEAPASRPVAAATAVEASACCGGCAGPNKQFVYAIGELQYDFPSVLRESSVRQHMEQLESVPGHTANPRNDIDFLRHLFGYQEVEVSVGVGIIEAIEVEPQFYCLSITPETYPVDPEKMPSFKISYGDKTTLPIRYDLLQSSSATSDILTRIKTELTGLTEFDIVVVAVNPAVAQETGGLRELIIAFRPKETPPTVPSGHLSLADVKHARVILTQTSGLRVTIPETTSGERAVTVADVGRQIGFNGVWTGKDESLAPSQLDSCNAMIIRGFGDSVGKGTGQVIYVETDGTDSGEKLSVKDAHYYIPRRSEVTRSHRANMHDANAVIWKLNRGKMEVYGIVPDGTFAEDAYAELAEFYMCHCGRTKEGLNYYYYKYDVSGRWLEWHFGWDPIFNDRECHRDPAKHALPLTQEKSERVAIPGVLQGEVQLITGTRLPAIKPDMRGTTEWTQKQMLDLLLPAVTGGASAKESIAKKVQSILERLDDMVRNPGVSPEQRALNHAATNLFNAIDIVADELGVTSKKNYQLDDIVVKRSEIGYAGSDCWDVEVSFFNEDSHLDSLLVVAQTIDVNDTIPALTDKPRKFRRR